MFAKTSETGLIAQSARLKAAIIAVEQRTACAKADKRSHRAPRMILGGSQKKARQPTGFSEKLN